MNNQNQNQKHRFLIAIVVLCNVVAYSAVAQTTTVTNMHEDGARFDQEGNLYRPLNETGVDYYKVEPGQPKGSGNRYVLQGDDTLKPSNQPITVIEGSLEHSIAIAHGNGFRLQTVEDKVRIAADRQHAQRKNDGKHMYYEDSPELKAALDEYKEQYGIEGDISAGEVARGKTSASNIESSSDDLWEIDTDQIETDASEVAGQSNQDGSDLREIDLDSEDSSSEKILEQGFVDVPESVMAEDLWSIDTSEGFIDLPKEPESWDDQVANLEGDVQVWEIEQDRIKMKEEMRRLAYEQEQARLHAIEQVRQEAEWQAQAVERQRQRVARAEKKQKEKSDSYWGTILGGIVAGTGVLRGDQALMNTGIELGRNLSIIEGNEAAANAFGGASSVAAYSGQTGGSSTEGGGDYQRCIKLADKEGSRAFATVGDDACQAGKAQESVLLTLKNAGCMGNVSEFNASLANARSVIRSAC